MFIRLAIGEFKVPRTAHHVYRIDLGTETSAVPYGRYSHGPPLVPVSPSTSKMQWRFGAVITSDLITTTSGWVSKK